MQLSDEFNKADRELSRRVTADSIPTLAIHFAIFALSDGADADKMHTPIHLQAIRFLNALANAPDISTKGEFGNSQARRRWVVVRRLTGYVIAQAYLLGAYLYLKLGHQSTASHFLHREPCPVEGK